jgi:hypothetical protein
MANSTSSFLKLTVQATGENSGTWGQITNTNLLIVEQAIAGFEAVALNATTGATLTFSNGAVSNGKNAVLKLTGTITSAVNVVVPVVEKVYIVDNATSGAYAVTVKTTSGTGVTWAAADKGTKMVYGDGTNIVDTAFTELSSDFSPQLSADLDTNGQNIIIDSTKAILDENSNEQIKFATTGSAVNEFSVTNAATSNAPALSVTGGDSNIDMTLTPKGTGRVTINGGGKIQQIAEKVTIAATGTTGTVNYDVITQSVLYHTTNAAGNFTVNIRGDGSTTLNNIMDTGESITVAFLVTQGSTPYYNSAVTIDGSSVTPEWSGGAAPSAGNASSVDIYTYTVIKTGDAAFTAFAAQTQFA